MITFVPEKRDENDIAQPLDGDDLGEIVIYDEPITEYDKTARITRTVGYKTRARGEIVTNEAAVPRYVVVDLTVEEAADVRAILYPKLIPAAKLVLGID